MFVFLFFIALQLLLGFTILCTAFNVNFSLRNRLEELEGSVQNSQIRVDILNDSVESGNFEYNTYSIMESDPACSTGILTMAIVKSTINGTPDSVVVLCVPNQYYYNLFSEDIDDSRVYCSQKLYNEISSNQVFLFGNGVDVELSPDKCTVNNHEYDLTVIDTTIKEISRDENPDHNISIDKTLIFPQAAGDFWEHDEFVSFQVFFYPTTSNNYLNAYKVLYENFSDVAISIYDGDYVSIMGRSGCGKSTLLNIIGGMDIASSGSYIFDGTEISDMSNRQLSDFRNRKIGYVFQQFHPIKDLSVIENIAMPLGYRGVAKKVRINAAEYALEQVGLFEKRDFNPKQLSGGEQQRIAIARAIVGEPSLIIADEPTGNLDSETSKKIMALFDFLHKSGKTILLVTHDTAVANYSTKKLYMSDGLFM